MIDTTLDYMMSNPSAGLQQEIINTIRKELGLPVTHELLGTIHSPQTATSQHIKKIIQEAVQPVIASQPRTIEPDEVDTVMTIKEAGQFLDLAVQTLYGLTSKREIPCFKKGKRLYFKKSELLLWIEEGKRKSRQQIRKEAHAYSRKKR